jgi:hypothetical protein
VSLQLPDFIDKRTAENTRSQLAGSGVWVQVAEILKTEQKIQNSDTSEKTKHAAPG